MLSVYYVPRGGGTDFFNIIETQKYLCYVSCEEPQDVEALDTDAVHWFSGPQSCRSVQHSFPEKSYSHLFGTLVPGDRHLLTCISACIELRLGSQT